MPVGNTTGSISSFDNIEAGALKKLDDTQCGLQGQLKKGINMLHTDYYADASGSRYSHAHTVINGREFFWWSEPTPIIVEIQGDEANIIMCLGENIQLEKVTASLGETSFRLSGVKRGTQEAVTISGRDYSPRQVDDAGDCLLFREPANRPDPQSESVAPPG